MAVVRMERGMGEVVALLPISIRGEPRETQGQGEEFRMEGGPPAPEQLWKEPPFPMKLIRR